MGWSKWAIWRELRTDSKTSPQNWIFYDFALGLQALFRQRSACLDLLFLIIEKSNPFCFIGFCKYNL
jgi:hypothetical protein